MLVQQSIEIRHLPVVSLTPDESKHAFFGYFDKSALDSSGRYHLACRSDFTGRQPEPSESLELGFIDMEDGMAFHSFSKTYAWCWQQGCMLQWLPGHPDTVIYNDRELDSFVCRIHHLKTGEIRTLPRPVYTVSPDGKFGLSLNFSRLDRERPGYGYPGGFDPFLGEDAPEKDGIWRVDMETGESVLLVSHGELRRRYHRESMNDTPNWFNHLLFSPDGRRFAFFHRWRIWRDGHQPAHITHMFTCGKNGDNVFPLNLEDMSSHYTWYGNNRILCFANQFKSGWQYYMFDDQKKDVEIIAPDLFPGDGHCSSSPDGKWMLTDSYPGEDECRRLFLYEFASGRAFEIGKFHSEVHYPIPARCDLHPRWSPDGRSITFDSTHERHRGIYRINVCSITSGV